MLSHPHRDRRQLRHLVTPRLDRVHPLWQSKHERARPAALGPMLDHLIHLLRPDKPPVPALMPLLATALALRPLPARPFGSRRRILRRRQRRVPRTPVQPTLELGNPTLEPLVHLHQTLVRCDQIIQPKQQPDSRLAITIQDRPRLSPVHTNTFAAWTEVPSPPERLRVLGCFPPSHGGGTGSNPVWAFLLKSDPRFWLRYVGQTCRGCPRSACGAYLGDTTRRCQTSGRNPHGPLISRAGRANSVFVGDANRHTRSRVGTEFDLHELRKLPIVPGEQLGGFRIGSPILDYRDLLLREHRHRFFAMPADRVRQKNLPWGEYWPTWGLAITLWPVKVHVDIRDGLIYRVEAQPGYEAGHNGITVGLRWAEARQLEPTIEWSEAEQSLVIPGSEGLYFGLTDEDPSGPDEYLSQLRIADIGVFDPARGTTLPF